jgi:hypothetical protein
MSSGKLDRSGVFDEGRAHSKETEFILGPGMVRMHKNGIEFKVLKPLPLWKEMTVGIQSHSDHKPTQFTGVVVACDGNRHAGYMVSMVIINMTRQAQEHLNVLASGTRL